jgi:hypothetical protein
LDSLYGGKQGQSFVLRGRFTSVQEMVDAFAKGASYTDVWYGEYVIIDTPNKNDADNGRIYQRGLNYDNEETGGAIEVGQVVGPSSGTPYIQLLSREKLNSIKEASQDDNAVTHTRFPWDANGDGNADENDDGSVITTSVKTNEIGDLSFDLDRDSDGTVDYGTSSLVPGYDANNGAYNDSIKYTWLNVRKDDADEDSWFYVGFQIPYLVQEFQTKEISPYDTDGNLIGERDSVTVESTNEVDGVYHPYYQHLTLGIPKGIKGDTVRNVRVVTQSATANKVYSDDTLTTTSDLVIYMESAITIDSKSGKVSFDATKTYAAEHDGQFYDKKQVYVYDLYWYDQTNKPAAYTIYIADYKDVRSVDISEDGTLLVTYTNNDTQEFAKCVRWVREVSLNTENGFMHVSMNNDGHDLPENYYFHLRWPTEMALDTTDGTLSVTYTNDGQTPEDASQEKKPVTEKLYDIPWITGMDLNADSGEFTATFNNDHVADIDKFLDWVKGATLAADGTLTWHHTNDGTKSGAVDVENGEKIQWITDARISSDGVITLVFNTLGEDGKNKTLVLKDASTGKDFHVKSVKDVDFANCDDTATRAEYNEFLRESKKLKITYNTTVKDSTGAEVNEYEYIGDPINYVEDMVVRPEDMHLLVLFSDPENRHTTTTTDGDSRTITDSQGRSWTTYLGTSGLNSGISTESDIWWRDFGSIKDTSGVMVGTKVVWSQNFGTESTVDTTLYPDGTDTSNVHTYDISYIKRWLNKKYPSGLTGSTSGKVIIYVDDHQADADEDTKNYFFAYDYDNPYVSADSVEANEGRGWFYIGAVSDTGGGGSVFLGDEDNAITAQEKVNSGGVWFRTSTLDYTTSTGSGKKVLQPLGIPKTWYAYTSLSNPSCSGTYE